MNLACDLEHVLRGGHIKPMTRAELRITLYRHGRIDLAHHTPKTLRRSRDAIQTYDAARPEPLSKVEGTPPAHIVASSLGRSQHGAIDLFGATSEVSSLFREAELPPHLIAPFQLSAATWITVARVLWLAGASNGCETNAEFKIRAKAAAAHLITCTQQHADVALVGHGWINRQIAKNLLKAGFSGPKKPSRQYGAASVYTKPQ